MIGVGNARAMAGFMTNKDNEMSDKKSTWQVMKTTWELVNNYIYVVPDGGGGILAFTGKYFCFSSKDCPGTAFNDYESARNARRKHDRIIKLNSELPIVKLKLYRSTK